MIGNRRALRSGLGGGAFRTTQRHVLAPKNPQPLKRAEISQTS